jgi:hypothetical protein
MHANMQCNLGGCHPSPSIAHVLFVCLSTVVSCPLNKNKKTKKNTKKEDSGQLRLRAATTDPSTQEATHYARTLTSNSAY